MSSLAIKVFALLGAVASPAVRFNFYARRSLGSPMTQPRPGRRHWDSNPDTPFLRPSSRPSPVCRCRCAAFPNGAMWWSWRESNPRPNVILVASYSHSGAIWCPHRNPVAYRELWQAAPLWPLALTRRGLGRNSVPTTTTYAPGYEGGAEPALRHPYDFSSAGQDAQHHPPVDKSAGRS